MKQNVQACVMVRLMCQPDSVQGRPESTVFRIRRGAFVSADSGVGCLP